DKLHQEIMSVLKQNELPTSGILGNMPYLDKHLTVLTKVFGLVGSVLMIFVTALIGQMFIG
ncbi:MAG: hypothetical protein AAF975_03000, partial [Spirochaetota bacterium]